MSHVFRPPFLGYYTQLADPLRRWVPTTGVVSNDKTGTATVTETGSITVTASGQRAGTATCSATSSITCTVAKQASGSAGTLSATSSVTVSAAKKATSAITIPKTFTDDFNRASIGDAYYSAGYQPAEIYNNQATPALVLYGSSVLRPVNQPWEADVSLSAKVYLGRNSNQVNFKARAANFIGNAPDKYVEVYCGRQDASTVRFQVHVSNGSGAQEQTWLLGDVTWNAADQKTVTVKVIGTVLYAYVDGQLVGYQDYSSTGWTFPAGETQLWLYHDYIQSPSDYTLIDDLEIRDIFGTAVSVAGEKGAQASVSLPVTSSITATGQHAAFVSGAATAAASITATAKKDVGGSATLTSTSTLDASGGKAVSGSAGTISATSSMTASAAKGAQGAAVFTRTFTDDFNRADVGDNYTTDGAAVIYNNQLAPQSGMWYDTNVKINNSTALNSSIAAKIASVGLYAGPILYLRVSTYNTEYPVYYVSLELSRDNSSTVSYRVRAVTAGGSLQTGWYSLSWSTGQQKRVELKTIGSTAYVYVEESLVRTFDFPDLAAPAGGAHIYLLNGQEAGTSTYIDDLEVKEFLVPVPSVAGKKGAQASITLPVTTSVTATGRYDAKASGTATATATLDATGRKDAFSTATLTHAASVESTGTSEVSEDKFGTASVTETTAIAATGTKSVAGSASLAATSTLTVNGSRSAADIGTLSAAGTLTATTAKGAISGAVNPCKTFTDNFNRASLGSDYTSSEAVIYNNQLAPPPGAWGDANIIVNNFQAANGSIAAKIAKIDLYAFPCLYLRAGNYSGEVPGVYVRVELNRESSSYVSWKIVAQSSGGNRQTSGGGTWTTGTQKVVKLTVVGTVATAYYDDVPVDSLDFSDIPAIPAGGAHLYLTNGQNSGTNTYIDDLVLTELLVPTLALVNKKGAQGAATLSVTSSVTAVGRYDAKASGTATAVATLDVTGRKDTSGVATLTHVAALDSTGRKAAFTSAALATAAEVSATGTAEVVVEKFGTATIEEAHAVTAPGRKSASGIATLTHATDLTTAGAKTAQGAVSLSLVTDLAVTGRKAASGAATLTHATSLTATGVALESHSGSATVTATASVAAQGRKATDGTGTASSESVITSTGQHAGARTVTLTHVQTVDSTGRKAASGTATLTHSTDLTATGAALELRSGSASVTETATLTGTGRKAATGTASVTHAGSITCTAAMGAAGSGTLSTACDLATQGAKGGRGAATVTEAISSSASSAKGGRGVADLAATATTTATASRQAQGTATVTATPVLDLAYHTNKAQDVEVRVGFTDAGQELIGTQRFRVLVRRDQTHTWAAGVPTLDIELWHDGAFVATLVEDHAVAASPEVVEGTWDASLVTGTDPTGQNVECRVVGYAGGTGDDRRTVEIGSIEWLAQYVATLNKFGAATLTEATTLTATGVKAALVTASVAQVAALSTAARKDVAGVADLPHAATLSGSERKGAASAVTLTLTPSLSASGSATEPHTGTATVTAAASLSASGRHDGRSSGTCSATVDCTVTGHHAGYHPATLDQAASLTTTTTKAARSAATLDLALTASTASLKAASSTATLTAATTLAAQGTAAEPHTGTATLSAAATLTATGTHQGTVAATLTAPATVTVTAAKAASGAATLTHAATLSATGTTSEAHLVSASVTVTTSVSGAARKGAAGNVTVTVSEVLTTAAAKAARQAATVLATHSVAVNASSNRRDSGVITVAVTPTVGYLAGRKTLISLSIADLLSAAANKQARVTAVVSVAPSAASTQRGSHSGVATLAHTPSVTATGQQLTQGEGVASITESTSLSVAARRGAASSPELTGSGGVSVGGVAGRRDAVVLALVGSISTVPLKSGQISVTIPLTISLAATVQGGHTGDAALTTPVTVTATGDKGRPDHIEELVETDATWELLINVTATFEGNIVSSAVREYDLAGSAQMGVTHAITATQTEDLAATSTVKNVA